MKRERQKSTWLSVGPCSWWFLGRGLGSRALSPPFPAVLMPPSSSQAHQETAADEVCLPSRLEKRACWKGASLSPLDKALRPWRLGLGWDDHTAPGILSACCFSLGGGCLALDTPVEWAANGHVRLGESPGLAHGTPDLGVSLTQYAVIQGPLLFLTGLQFPV